MDCDMSAKRKKRLKGILKDESYAEGGFVDADEEMSAMDMDEDEFLSDEDESSEIDPKSLKEKRKQRLFALMAPSFKRK